MGETATQIEHHISEERKHLGQNLNELQQRTEEALSWRARFRARPMMALGIAFGDGLLLSLLGNENRS
jgi:ElaB/YqjD/DUF883 family membrane-anchored ribosome-binding protein